MGERVRTVPTAEGLEVLAEALFGGGTSQAIERQEARGQTDFVNSTMLPRTVLGGSRQDFVRMGIVFDESVTDDLFIQATLPPGWSKRATEHSMHSELLDDKGRKRASIFYKAAFYDRSAHMSAVRRFFPNYQPVGGWDAYDGPRHPGACWEGVALDCGEVVWRSEPQADGPGQFDWASDKCTALAKAWLDDSFPGWNDVHAYWD